MLVHKARRRFVSHQPRAAGVQDWDAIHREADMAYPVIRDAILEHIAAVRAAIRQIEGLASLLATGQHPHAMALIRQAWRARSPLLQAKIRLALRALVGRAARAALTTWAPTMRSLAKAHGEHPDVARARLAAQEGARYAALTPEERVLDELRLRLTSGMEEAARRGIALPADFVERSGQLAARLAPQFQADPEQVRGMGQQLAQSLLTPVVPAEVAGLLAGLDVQVLVAFDQVNAAAVAYIEEAAATLVREIGDDTMRGIRAVIQRAFEQGRTPLQVQHDIEQMVGLHSRQMQALERFRAKLEADGFGASRIEQLTENKAKQMRELRAETIARTETINAATEGQQRLWEAAREQGFVPPGMKRFWITTGDDRLCPLCAPIPGMNSKGVGLDEPFQTPRGAIMRPTLHPMCRCAVSLRRV